MFFLYNKENDVEYNKKNTFFGKKIDSRGNYRKSEKSYKNTDGNA